jgi:DNA-binding transcriptional regulator YiaG
MTKTLDQKLNKLSATRRKKIEARASAFIAEERSLQELRRALRLTQKHMAQKLGIGQEGVSRLEQRSDLLLSTLSGYIKAMGGTLSIVAEFPDRQPVILTGLASLSSDGGSGRSASTPAGRARPR